MTIKEEISEELRKRTPWAEIRRRYRSQSQTYDAIRIFLDEIDTTIGERQKELQELEESLFAVKDEFDRLNDQMGEVSKQREQLAQKKDEPNSEVESLSGQLTKLRENIAELQTKGFTSNGFTVYVSSHGGIPFPISEP